MTKTQLIKTRAVVKAAVKAVQQATASLKRARAKVVNTQAQQKKAAVRAKTAARHAAAVQLRLRPIEDYLTDDGEKKTSTALAHTKKAKQTKAKRAPRQRKHGKVFSSFLVPIFVCVLPCSLSLHFFYYYLFIDFICI